MPPSEEVALAKAEIQKAMIDLRASGRSIAHMGDVANWAGYEEINTEEFYRAIHRYKAFRAAFKELSEDGELPGTKEELHLNVPEEELVEDPNEEELQANMLFKILEGSAESFPEPSKITAVFNQLLDGRAHFTESLAKTAGYSSVDTESFECLMHRMTVLGLVQVEGTDDSVTAQFLDIVFPLGGRPTDGVRKCHLEVPSERKKRKRSEAVKKEAEVAEQQAEIEDEQKVKEDEQKVKEEEQKVKKEEQKVKVAENEQTAKLEENETTTGGKDQLEEEGEAGSDDGMYYSDEVV